MLNDSRSRFGVSVVLGREYPNLSADACMQFCLTHPFRNLAYTPSGTWFTPHRGRLLRFFQGSHRGLKILVEARFHTVLDAKLRRLHSKFSRGTEHQLYVLNTTMGLVNKTARITSKRHLMGILRLRFSRYTANQTGEPYMGTTYKVLC